MKKILLVALMSLSVTGCWEVSNGEKVGVIVKCAHEGIFIKTFECELIRGGMNNGSGSFGKSFHFTAENKSDIPMLKQALDTQQEVKITYHIEMLSLARSENNSTFLDSIEIIK
jgi:hypothetical protein